MSIHYCGWRPLRFQVTSGNDHRLGQIDLLAAGCRILSPPILSSPSRASGHLIIHVMSSAKQKSRAIPMQSGLITAFAASYITLADYQTAISPYPPSSRPLKRMKAAKEKRFNRLQLCKECRRDPMSFWVTLPRFGPEFEATLTLMNRTGKDGEFMNRSRTSKGKVCF